jgi:hypothetical protein
MFLVISLFIPHWHTNFNDYFCCRTEQNGIPCKSEDLDADIQRLKEREMKKISMILFVLAAVFAGVFAEGTEPAGIQPQMVQAAFYTPSYQCVYLKGSDELGLAYIVKINAVHAEQPVVKPDNTVTSC